MNEYKWVTKRFFAWSEMQCNKAQMDREDHLPHSWNSDVVAYGPYMCWGFPNRKDTMPTEAELKELVGEQMKAILKLRPFIPDASRPAEAIDKVMKWVES